MLNRTYDNNLSLYCTMVPLIPLSSIERYKAGREAQSILDLSNVKR